MMLSIHLTQAFSHITLVYPKHAVDHIFYPILMHIVLKSWELIDAKNHFTLIKPRSSTG